MTNKISIRIGGKDEDVNASAFLAVVSETIHLLKDLDAQMGDGTRSMSWVLSAASKNSPVCVEFSGRTKSADMTPPAVVAEFLGSMARLEEGAGRPSYFTDAMLDRAKKIAAPIGTRIAKVIYAGSNNEPVTISGRLVANADTYHLPDKYAEYSEIEGELGQITAHGDDYEFCIFDPVTDRSVKCEFEPAELDRVLGKMRRRVRASGLVTYRRKDDSPISVRVDDWHELPAPEDIPSIEEVHALGVDLTRGRPSEDVIRALRVFNA